MKVFTLCLPGVLNPCLKEDRKSCHGHVITLGSRLCSSEFVGGLAGIGVQKLRNVKNWTAVVHPDGGWSRGLVRLGKAGTKTYLICHKSQTKAGTETFVFLVFLFSDKLPDWCLDPGKQLCKLMFSVHYVDIFTSCKSADKQKKQNNILVSSNISRQADWIW